jgi:hypothetical protein
MVRPALRIEGTSGTGPGRNSCDALCSEALVGESRTANAIRKTPPVKPLVADGGLDRLQRSDPCVAEIINAPSPRLFVRVA